VYCKVNVILIADSVPLLQIPLLYLFGGIGKTTHFENKSLLIPVGVIQKNVGVNNNG